MNNAGPSILRFVLLIALQALVIDHIDLANGWVVPYPYTLFIVMLPFATPAWAALLLAFAAGLCMDWFSSTPGMHAGACVFMAWLRIFMLRALAPREGYEAARRPSVPSMGLAWFMTFAGTLVLAHHLFLFYAEMFRFDHFFATFFRALLSTAATLLLFLLMQALSFRSGTAR